MNLLIKDIVKIPAFGDTLSEVMSVIKFIRNHQQVLAAFQRKHKQYQVRNDLVMVVPTRWYSHYNACRYLRSAKFGIQALLEDDVAPVLDGIQKQVPVIVFICLAGKPGQIIGKFEKDDCDSFHVYYYFSKLQTSWDNKLTIDSVLLAKLKAIVPARWKFVHTDSMGFAYMLTPRSSTIKWEAKANINTKIDLLTYINHFYEKDEVAECMDELNSFLSIYTTSSLAELNKYNGLSGLHYWWQYGLSEYPLLTAIAVRVFSVPTSSAAAEKLAFVYINRSLLAEKDKIDYIRSYVQDEDEDEDDDGVGEETDLEVGLADYE
ncbi:hypothetical protein PHMEG_00013942 [Phytophthora megakarya]|uniref:HAT C-terminal dimerisation domain-containing protein n=1 Tax=Phytophthora megakarya TaxID=4795 RepID=A0A225W517_9STRA|nr:hypothetical protein PHMEG_00013942 [Phytophthora megakarya]